jgi:hypothetical protein
VVAAATPALRVSTAEAPAAAAAMKPVAAGEAAAAFRVTEAGAATRQAVKMEDPLRLWALHWRSARRWVKLLALPLAALSGQK